MDLNTICRLCTRENVKFHPIFDVNDKDTQNETVEKILFISSIEIFKNDGLPENICELCRYKLDVAYSFKQQILLSDEKLRLHVSALKLSIKSEKEDWIKLEDEDVTYVEVKHEYENGDDVSLQDIFQVELSENIDSSESDKIIVVENKKRCPNKQKEQRTLTRVCPECGRLLKRDSYRDHMLTQHKKESEIECEICGTKLKTKRQLWHHKKKKHEEPEKISCDQCGLIFTSQNNFKRHYNNVHLGLKKHDCKLCEKSFALLKTLKTHIRSHTGERPYICTYCNRGFSGQWALKQHVWLHTNEKPYKCELCSESFTQNVTLKLHVKRKHMGITPDKEKQNKTNKE